MKKIVIGAALLALVAGQVEAQPGQRERPAGGQRGAGGFRGGGARPEGARSVDRSQFQNRGAGGGFDRSQFQNRGGRAAQIPAAPAAQAASPSPNAAAAGRRFVGGNGFQGQGQRFNSQGAGRTAPDQAERRQGLQGGRFNDQRFQNGQVDGRRFGDGRFNGQRFGGQFGGQGQSLSGQGGQRFSGQRFGGRGGRAFNYRGRSYGAFRAQPYRFPRGYSYRRYGIRSFLPLAFLSSAWLLNDYSSYYLAPPPSQQFQWVRYGPDALLVDTSTGQVVDAAYGVFDEGQADGGQEGFDYYSQYGDGSEDGYEPPPPPAGPY